MYKKVLSDFGKVVETQYILKKQATKVGPKTVKLKKQLLQNGWDFTYSLIPTPLALFFQQNFKYVIYYIQLLQNHYTMTGWLQFNTLKIAEPQFKSIKSIDPKFKKSLYFIKNKKQQVQMIIVGINEQIATRLQKGQFILLANAILFLLCTIERKKWDKLIAELNFIQNEWTWSLTTIYYAFMMYAIIFPINQVSEMPIQKGLNRYWEQIFIKKEDDFQQMYVSDLENAMPFPAIKNLTLEIFKVLQSFQLNGMLIFPKKGQIYDKQSIQKGIKNQIQGQKVSIQKLTRSQISYNQSKQKINQINKLYNLKIDDNSVKLPTNPSQIQKQFKKKFDKQLSRSSDKMNSQGSLQQKIPPPLMAKSNVIANLLNNEQVIMKKQISDLDEVQFSQQSSQFIKKTEDILDISNGLQDDNISVVSGKSIQSIYTSVSQRQPNAQQIPYTFDRQNIFKKQPPKKFHQLETQIGTIISNAKTPQQNQKIIKLKRIGRIKRKKRGQPRFFQSINAYEKIVDEFLTKISNLQLQKLEQQSIINIPAFIALQILNIRDYFQKQKTMYISYLTQCKLFVTRIKLKKNYSIIQIQQTRNSTLQYILKAFLQLSEKPMKQINVLISKAQSIIDKQSIQQKKMKELQEYVKNNFGEQKQFFVTSLKANQKRILEITSGITDQINLLNGLGPRLQNQLAGIITSNTQNISFSIVTLQQRTQNVIGSLQRNLFINIQQSQQRLSSLIILGLKGNKQSLDKLTQIWNKLQSIAKVTKNIQENLFGYGDKILSALQQIKKKNDSFNIQKGVIKTYLEQNQQNLQSNYGELKQNIDKLQELKNVANQQFNQKLLDLKTNLTNQTYQKVINLFSQSLEASSSSSRQFITNILEQVKKNKQNYRKIQKIFSQKEDTQNKLANMAVDMRQFSSNTQIISQNLTKLKQISETQIPQTQKSVKDMQTNIIEELSKTKTNIINQIKKINNQLKQDQFFVNSLKQLTKSNMTDILQKIKSNKLTDQQLDEITKNVNSALQLLRRFPKNELSQNIIGNMESIKQLFNLIGQKFDGKTLFQQIKQVKSKLISSGGGGGDQPEWGKSINMRLNGIQDILKKVKMNPQPDPDDGDGGEKYKNALNLIQYLIQMVVLLQESVGQIVENQTTYITNFLQDLSNTYKMNKLDVQSVFDGIKKTYEKRIESIQTTFVNKFQNKQINNFKRQFPSLKKLNKNYMEQKAKYVNNMRQPVAKINTRYATNFDF